MSKNKKSGVGKFILGATIGAALGVLFAPKKGSETRQELKLKLDEMLDRAKDVDINEVKEDIELKIFELREKLEDLDKETVLKIAKKKAKAIQDMAEELLEYAIDKGTPVLERTANSIREKSISITKEVLKKLEKEQ